MNERKSEYMLKTCPECKKEAMIERTDHEMDAFPEDDDWGYIGGTECCANCGYGCSIEEKRITKEEAAQLVKEALEKSASNG